jgi:hypothetical protein
MSYIVITRYGLSDRPLAIITDDENPVEFETEDAAEKCADENPLCQAFGYQIVEVDV